MRNTTISILLLSATLCAQTGNPVAYPADTLRGGSGNLAPFGYSTANTFDEARWQQIIPARFLPTTPCLLTGLAVNCQSSSSAVTYTTLQIVLSNTTATALGNSFSGNLPAPITVFNGTTHTIPWSINKWVGVTFTAPFVYNGVDNLVVSISKAFDRLTYPAPGIVTHQTSGSPSRSDLGQTKYVASVFGGGALANDVAQYTGASPISMRVYCAVQGSTTIASLTQPNSREFAINTSLSLTVWGSNGAGWGTVIDTGFIAPVTIPTIAGAMIVNPAVALASGTMSGNSASLTIAIPNNPTLVGAYLALQSITAAPAPSYALAFTNAVDLFINS
jgi:hypothetical protein